MITEEIKNLKKEIFDIHSKHIQENKEYINMFEGKILKLTELIKTKNGDNKKKTQGEITELMFEIQCATENILKN